MFSIDILYLTVNSALLQIRPLFGNDPWTLLPVVIAVILQTAAAASMGIYNVPWWVVCALAYAFGSFGAGNLMAAHHEISHFLVFKKPSWNKVLWIIANCPLGVPLGSLFKQYHVDHHASMGVDGVDTGIWTATEHWWVRRSATVKTLFLTIFPIPFFFRPFFMRIQKQLDLTDLASWIVIPAFDVALSYYAGYSLKPVAFLIMGTYHGVGLHPIAGHVISEHVNLTNDGQETHSCYDPYLNPLLYNFGYHVEHHDFPNIPWRRLPQLRGIAPEFYNHLTSYPTWSGVIWRFITDPNIGSTGVMVKRVKHTGGEMTSLAAAGKKIVYTPVNDMPLMRGITATSIH